MGAVAFAAIAATVTYFVRSGAAREPWDNWKPRRLASSLFMGFALAMVSGLSGGAYETMSDGAAAEHMVNFGLLASSIWWAITFANDRKDQQDMPNQTLQSTARRSAVDEGPADSGPTKLVSGQSFANEAGQPVPSSPAHPSKALPDQGGTRAGRVGASIAALSVIGVLSFLVGAITQADAPSSETSTSHVAETNWTTDSPGSNLSEPWLSPGDCLNYHSVDTWAPALCLNHHAEVISRHIGARSDASCPDSGDIWFSDSWGVYCALVISDNTPEGGHWGIGPVNVNTCLNIDERRLIGKTVCDSHAVPVLHISRGPEVCEAMAFPGPYRYWESVDGSNNYICVAGH